MSEDKIKHALTITKRYAAASAGAAAIPVPYLDVSAVGTVQYALVRHLARVYEVPFHEERARGAILTLCTSTSSLYTAHLFKHVPIIGRLAVTPVALGLSVASTYAIGKVFIQHFESGGTFLTLEPDSVVEHYQRHFEAHRRGDPTAVVDSEFADVEP